MYFQIVFVKVTFNSRPFGNGFFQCNGGFGYTPVFVRAKKQRAEESNTLKNIFLGNIAQETRFPANMICGLAQMMKAGINPSKHSEYISIIYRNCRKLLEIIDDIVQLSQIESGQIELRHEICSINSIIEEAHLYLEDRAGESGKPITISHGPLLGENESLVYADSLCINQAFKKLIANAAKHGMEVIPVCAKLEEEIAQLDPEEKQEFIEEMGLGTSGLDRLVKLGYDLLGYISFLTAGADECRAWTIVRGTKAPQAAGKIHTDFERGFIRAEIVAFNDLYNSGSMAAAKEKGLVRSEGKDYVMHDGDVTLFRFNV